MTGRSGPCRPPSPRVRERAGTDAAAKVGIFCMAGADLPSDDRRLARALKPLGLADEITVRNDTFAVLRAGSERSWGVGVVCGTGLNCAAVGPTGRTVRYAALGVISGDEGGGGWLGAMALSTAVRSRDGRGERSALEQAVPAHFGLASPLKVTEAIHTGRLDHHRLTELAPVVLRASAEGDAPAAVLVDQLADEAAAMVVSAVRRLRITRTDVEVVLGGGIMRSRDARFLGRVRDRILAVAPNARIVPIQAPPVVGAALLGLDRLGAANGAHERVRGTLTDRRLSRNGRV